VIFTIFHLVLSKGASGFIFTWDCVLGEQEITTRAITIKTKIDLFIFSLIEG
jgi:hypothetical protein